MSLFEKEWEVLQNQYDSYEKFSLLIKVFAISVVLLGVGLSINFVFLVCITFVLWLQDGIWKTFQSRIEQRLYLIEGEIASQNTELNKSFQFNSEFINNRPNHLGLIKLYVEQSLRPTVAFPYIVLIPLILAYHL